MDALLWCVRIAAGEVAFFTQEVLRLQEDEYVGHPTSTKERPLSYGKDGDSASETVTEIMEAAPALHIMIAARHAALERMAKFSKMAADAGIAEREVKLAEQYGDLIGQFIGRVLDGLGLSDEQQAKAPELVRRHLTSLLGNEMQVVA